MEQKNWAIVRTVVGYHRYDTKTELLLLNKIWALQSLLTNYFYLPAAKTRLHGPRRRQSVQEIRHRHNPHRRAERHEAVCAKDKAILADTYTGINPAAVQRQIQA